MPHGTKSARFHHAGGAGVWIPEVMRLVVGTTARRGLSAFRGSEPPQETEVPNIDA